MNQKQTVTPREAQAAAATVNRPEPDQGRST